MVEHSRLCAELDDVIEEEKTIPSFCLQMFTPNNTMTFSPFNAEQLLRFLASSRS